MTKTWQIGKRYRFKTETNRSYLVLAVHEGNAFCQQYLNDQPDHFHYVFGTGALDRMEIVLPALKKGIAWLYERGTDKFLRREMIDENTRKFWISEGWTETQVEYTEIRKPPR